jgi:hypothetical protein
LRQQVEFSWNFVGVTNQAGVLQAVGAAGNVKTATEAAATSQNPSINGKLRLGPSPEMEINAAPQNSAGQFFRSQSAPVAPGKAQK